ncbi:MAG: cellulose 1,4-beta-cellobiosidase, partial [Ilumatobacteraceae bacterium]
MNAFGKLETRRRSSTSRGMTVAAAIALCIVFAVAQGPSRSPAGAKSVSAAAGWNWYKTDPHVHSTFSADAFSDIGIHAQAAKAQGYNALFLTDHDGGSSFLINNMTANHRLFEDKYTNWTASTFGTQSSSTNVLATSPVASGTASLHLASTSATYGETGVWSTRGSNFRSGDIILKVKIYPTRIDANSGVYVSASIGGDLNVVKFPKGYTTEAGVISPAKTTVLVWQLGNPRTPSSNANTRVITNNLAYTLNQWNSYTINVTQAMAAIPAADRPLNYDAFTYLRMVAAGKGGTADAYFDTYSMDASLPVASADEFVYRTPLVSSYDTSTFKIFSSYEMGQSKHSQRFNFAITSPTQYVHYANGIDGIRPTQDMGYPAQLNHPGTGTTVAEAISGRGLGADTIEVTNPAWRSAWDEILKQGTQILGAFSSDTHSGETANTEATFLYSPALTFDDLVHSYYEGRSYSAVNNFAGRLVFNLDGSGTEPYPARYPVFVPSTQTSRNVHLSITSGLVSGYKVRWIRNGVALATDSTSGSSYNVTKVIDVTGDPTYVRAELLNGAGTVIAVTQPIFFRDVAGLPSGNGASVDQVVTSNGRGYNRILTQGITAATFDAATNRLNLTFVNTPSALAEAQLPTPSAPSSVTVNAAPVTQASGATEFNAATASSWYYDGAASTMHLKVLQPGSSGTTSTAAVAVSYGGGGGGDTTAPSVPAGVAATATGPTVVDVSWQASTDNVGVTGYEVSRGGAVVAALVTGTSYQDTTVSPSTTYSYTVRARDAAGNWSAAGAAPPVTT